MKSEILKKAIATYGKEAQTLMFFEETAELEKELCKNARGKDNTKEITEELADVLIMLEQIIIMYGIDRMELANFQSEKLQRLRGRLGM